MATSLDRALALILPKTRQRKGAVSRTPTFNPDNAVLSIPAYRDHLTDLFATRQVNDSRTLLTELFRHNPDVSSAVNAYLTLADTDYEVWAYDEAGELDIDGIKLAHRVLEAVSSVYDYSLNFQIKRALRDTFADFRYMLLLRGSIGAELVFDKTFVPTEIRQVDMNSITWVEKQPGIYKPEQTVTGEQNRISLDIPTFFTSSYRQNPTQIYSYSPFVAAINSIAARQQVINDLYRIMKVTGFPRIDIQVMEELLKKNAPAAIRDNPKEYDAYVAAQFASIQGLYAGLEAHDAFIHTDSVEAKVINDKNPGSGLQIKEVMETLDAENQAALKVMATVVGKGDGNSQTASTEARLFALSADQLNRPIETVMSQLLTLAVRLAGYPGRVVLRFRPSELRPLTELEPQLTMRAQRLKEDLSLGLITDDQYHMEMYGRPRPDSAPELSGTNFATGSIGMDVEGVSPNGDALGQSVTSKKITQAPRSKSVKKAA